MKRIIKPFIFLICLTSFGFRAEAQWDVLTNLFGQFDPGTNEFFNNNLDSLDTNWNPSDYQGQDLFGGLYNNLLDSIPPGGLDSTYLNAVAAGIDSLPFHLNGFGLSGADYDTIFGEADWLNGVFNNNFDSLGGLFGQYQDSLSLPPNFTDLTIINGDSLHNAQYDYLQGNFNNSNADAEPSGLGNLPPIFGNLFDINIFPDIEIAFGTQNADLKYFGDEYRADAKIIRLGSVPRFDREVSSFNDASGPQFPIEARWHVDMSWTNETRNAPQGDIQQANLSSEGKGFSPLMLNGDFAIMTTPSLGKLGNTTFKMITSLGTEIGTYAPAHTDYNWPVTANNKGYMTGLGAQVGAGFSFTTGAVTAYTLATFAQGQALRCPKPYPYTSRRYEVGIRYGNIINVRYSSGFVSWQDNENRQANVRNQFTVGIILPELHH